MPEMTRLTAADGHELDGFVVMPDNPPKGAVVIIQEIFGVNPHIQSVVKQYAGRGYAAIAPAMFDRIEPRIEIPYTDVPGGLAHLQKLDPAESMMDLKSAAAWASQFGRTGIVGYCWGGTMAHLASANGVGHASVAYYGGHIVNFLDRAPKTPIIYHFGTEDGHIPAEAIDKIHKAFPAAPVYTYEGAGHGFNCDARADYDPKAASEAFQTSLDFLAEHVDA